MPKYSRFVCNYAGRKKVVPDGVSKKIYCPCSRDTISSQAICNKCMFATQTTSYFDIIGSNQKPDKKRQTKQKRNRFSDIDIVCEKDVKKTWK